MDNNVTIEPLYSILTSKQIDLASLQIFDIQGLLVKQDQQIRALAEYIFNNAKLNLTVSISDTTIYFAGKQVAVVEYDSEQRVLTLTFVDEYGVHRDIVSAFGMANNQRIDVTIEQDNIIKINLPSTIESVNLTVL